MAYQGGGGYGGGGGGMDPSVCWRCSHWRSIIRVSIELTLLPNSTATLSNDTTATKSRIALSCTAIPPASIKAPSTTTTESAPPATNPPPATVYQNHTQAATGTCQLTMATTTRAMALPLSTIQAMLIPIVWRARMLGVILAARKHGASEPILLKHRAMRPR